MYSEELRQKINKIRKRWKRGNDERDSGLKTDSADVTRFNNIVYGPYGESNLLDLYIPKNCDKAIPLIINIHGGGYFYGTKETYQFYCLFLAQQGFAVINFNYRLAPDYEFPNNIEDVQRILNWVEINGSKFNLDLQHVFLVGDSAGGQMVVQTLIIDTNSKYRHLFGFVKPKLRILAGATNCGGFIIDNYRNLNKKSSDLDKIVTLYFMHHQKTAMCDLTKVQKYLTCNFPPIYIMTANLDFIKEQSILLDNFLKTKGVKHEFHLYGDEQHKLLHVFNIDQKNEIATQCNLDEIRFFKSFL